MSDPDIAAEKKLIRDRLRKARRDYAASLDESTRALLFRRPPGPVMDMIPPGAIVGVYYDIPGEAPARAYARFLCEQGHTVALPAFADRDAPMHFREWSDPFAESDLEDGPFGPQPVADNGEVRPTVLFVPLVAFTETGERMGQGAAHYDGWMANNPGVTAIGMAWDMQKVPNLPTEPHDIPLNAIVTPSQFYGPFT